MHLLCLHTLQWTHRVNALVDSQSVNRAAGHSSWLPDCHPGAATAASSLALMVLLGAVARLVA